MLGETLWSRGVDHDEKRICHCCLEGLGRLVVVRSNVLSLMAISLTSKPRLRREIIITLLVKFTVIYALWYLFFSEPVDENLEAPQVADALFGSAPVSSPLAADSVINPVPNPKEK